MMYKNYMIDAVEAMANVGNQREVPKNNETRQRMLAGRPGLTGIAIV
jgi:hypothetical protein